MTSVFVNPDTVRTGGGFHAVSARPRPGRTSCRGCRFGYPLCAFRLRDVSIGLCDLRRSRRRDRSAGREGTPGTFPGVATVVAKLANIVRPHVMLLGQKDAQQVVVIRRMLADLNTGVKVVVVPTVREADGLALSSRNAYLSAGRTGAGPRALPCASGGGTTVSGGRARMVMCCVR